MRKIFILLMVVVTVLLGLIGCSSAPDTTDVPRVYSDTDEIIDVNEYEHFFITLISRDRDLGYRWGAYFDGSVISLIETTVQKDLDNQAEAGDTEWFEFKALKTGASEITLVYKQWFAEGMTKPIDEKVFSVNIH